MLGYFTSDGNPVILGAYDCQKFIEQTLISAIPEPKEYHEIAVSLPSGIGVVGMYHSHPAGSNIFHSHIDDSTVLDYSKLAPNFVSVVTNGKDVQCFMLVDPKSGKLKKIEPALGVPEIPPSTVFRVNFNICIPKSEDQMEPQMITSPIADLFYNNWGNRRYLSPAGRIDLGDKTQLTKIPEEGKSHARYIDVDLGALQTKKDLPKDNFISISGPVQVEIYHKKDELLHQVDRKVQAALLNHLNQRILKGQMDASGKSWTLDSIHTIRFWDIPLSITFSIKKGKNECEDFLQGMCKRLQFLPNLVVQKQLQLREQIRRTLTDLDTLAAHYGITSQKDMLDQLKKKYLNSG